MSDNDETDFDDKSYSSSSPHQHNIISSQFGNLDHQIENHLKSRFAMLSNLPKELELRPYNGVKSVDQMLFTVWAKCNLKKGTLFGPYPGKTRKDPIASTFNWKVS